MGTSCRARSSPTRSRLRRLRRSPPSTWPSTGRPRTALLMPLSVPTPTSRASPRTVLGLAAPPLDLCKRKLNRTGCRVSIYNAKDLLSAKAQHYLMFPLPPLQFYNFYFTLILLLLHALTSQMRQWIALILTYMETNPWSYQTLML